MLHLFFGEIVLSVSGKHRLVGYAQKCLGNWAKALISISVFVTMAGTLLAYIIIAGNFLKIILGSSLGLSSTALSVLFAVILSFFIFRGIKLIARAELLMNVLFLLIIGLVLVIALPKLNPTNFTLFNLSGLFLPYGVVLFAFSAWSAIPAIADVLKTREERKKYKKVIITGMILVFALYLVFSLAVVGVSGANTTQDALAGLVSVLGSKIIFLGALFGILSIASSFLILGNYFKNTLRYDHDLPCFLAASIACGIPLVLFVAGLRSFIASISLVGTLLGVLEGIVIVLMFMNIKNIKNREPEYSLKVPQIVLYLLIAVFVLGAVSQLI